ncbi:MAG: tRNA (adenosine(37)-N6)-threonylcarbamoyltransferase complex ATPase subunit type 1 TsaE [Proteobacteria bacterium]|nr:tRNA (adenosine(37)-N6)-threonylcarbamoyltransferase complex ATPase subunit type 1 TsaE [Pseudomonadota bacterium]
MSQLILSITHPQAMENIGRQLYEACRGRGIILYLKGNLGAGKTTLVRGFLRAMSFHGNVKSPTYTLVEPYEFLDATVYHFDFYRLNAPAELEYMGIRDYFLSGNYCLVEWPEKASSYLPESDLQIDFNILDDIRKVTLNAVSKKGEDVLQKLRAE